MNDDVPIIEGPRTIRYFTWLLVAAVFLFVLGVILNEFYSFPWLESAISPFLDDPMILFWLASVLAILVISFIVGKFVLKLSGQSHRR